MHTDFEMNNRIPKQPQGAMGSHDYLMDRLSYVEAKIESHLEYMEAHPVVAGVFNTQEEQLQVYLQEKELIVDLAQACKEKPILTVFLERMAAARRKVEQRQGRSVTRLTADAALVKDRREIEMLYELMRQLHDRVTRK